MSLINEPSDSERGRFLHVMQESLLVDQHFRLLLWLQGELQYFLPHEVLITAVGDFARGRVKLELVTASDGKSGGDCASCSLQRMACELFERWQKNGRQLVTIEGAEAVAMTAGCGCAMGEKARRGRTMLVHGLRDQRSGEDALYIMINSEHQPAERRAGLFSLMMPQIDFACRRAAERRCAQAASEEAPAADQLSGLSPREMEILDWVRAGKTNVEIGMILNISAFTVKNHLQRIFRKIDVINRAQAVAKVGHMARYQ